jgi:streptogramin lyase
MLLRSVSSAARAVFPILAAGVWICVLAGCAGSVKTTGTGSGSYEGSGFSGTVQVGTQPLIGASVNLYAAGTSGNGSSGAALLSNSLTTDSQGSFTVPSGYACSSESAQIYLVARGGKPGSTTTADNNAIALFTPLGACGQSRSSVVVNEVTTVAATYALSQFLSAGGNLGATSTNTVGLENAVATAQALADISKGSSPGPAFAANGSSPAARIDTLANLLNACAVSTASGSACSALFANTETASGTPDNTLDALLNLVRNPAANVAALYTLSAASMVFTPVLTAAPSDWTLFINYTGGGMNNPTSLGLDSAGNVWVASYLDAASLFSPLGVPLLSQGVSGYGLGYSFGLAVDANNDAWITNFPSPYATGNSVSVFSTTGAALSGTSGYTAGANSYPTGVAIDTDGSAWVVDWGESHLTHLSSSGQLLANVTSAQLIDPVEAVIDASHYVWVTNEGGDTVTRVSQDGSQFTSYNCCNGPSGLAIDQSGNVWVANYEGNSISEISSTGVVLSNGGFTSGSLDDPQSIAIDGAGTVWICSYRGNSLTELAGSSSTKPGAVLSPDSGLGADANLIEAYAIAADASGSLWVSNRASSTLTQFVGLASPVRTPLIGLPAAP